MTCAFPSPSLCRLEAEQISNELLLRERKERVHLRCSQLESGVGEEGRYHLRNGGVLLAGVTSNLEVAQTFHMHFSCAFALKLINGSDMDFSSWNNTESNLLRHACCCLGKKPSQLLLCDCVTPAPSSVSLLCNMNARYLESSPSCPYSPHYQVWGVTKILGCILDMPCYL